MRWSARQRAMLQAMGLRLWDAPPLQRRDAPSQGEAAVAAASPAGTTNTAKPAPAREAQPARQPDSTLPEPAHGEVAATPSEILDVGKLDWPALRAAVSSCRACALCESRTQTVFGTGNPDAHWMIVGEAPGMHEDRLGEPFVGKAGQLLDVMLRAIGLTREPGPAARQVFIANTLKCRPPGNRNPLPDELARCEPFLVRQIELVRPRVILAMGRFAVQALLRSNEPIGRLRGRLHRYHGVPLVVTYHPAYLLRNPLDKARAWDDLRFALEVWRRCDTEGEHRPPQAEAIRAPE
jgi:DNA polymerase